jgi:hypothetical protein
MRSLRTEIATILTVGLGSTAAILLALRIDHPGARIAVGALVLGGIAAILIVSPGEGRTTSWIAVALLMAVIASPLIAEVIDWLLEVSGVAPARLRHTLLAGVLLAWTLIREAERRSAESRLVAAASLAGWPLACGAAIALQGAGAAPGSVFLPALLAFQATGASLALLAAGHRGRAAVAAAGYGAAAAAAPVGWELVPLWVAIAGVVASDLVARSRSEPGS